MANKAHTDIDTTIAWLKGEIGQFVREREWNQFHTLKNLSMNLAVEASELMEKFLWVSTEASIKDMPNKRREIEDELADVFIAAIAFANAAEIDVSTAFKRKIAEVCKKYPIEKARGRADKYTDL